MVEFKINECITCKNHEGDGERNVKPMKENIVLHEQLDEMGHRWETSEANVANPTDAIDRVVGLLKIYPIGARRRPGDDLDLCLNILQSVIVKINSMKGE